MGDFTDVSNGCPRCRGENYRFERSFRLGRYEGLLRELILRTKQPESHSLAENLGRLWVVAQQRLFVDAKADVVIPVPLHWRRRWSRGFNQAACLASSIAACLGIPHRPGWLRRVKATPPQTEVSPTMRRQNLRNAFKTTRRSRLQGKAVLLIDDVFTTGTTVNEASRALLKAGAARVVVAVLAHR